MDTVEKIQAEIAKATDDKKAVAKKIRELRKLEVEALRAAYAGE